MSSKITSTIEDSNQLELCLIATLIQYPLSLKLISKEITLTDIFESKNKVFIDVVIKCIKSGVHIDQASLENSLSNEIIEVEEIKNVLELDMSEINLADIIITLKDLTLRRDLISTLYDSIEKIKDTSNSVLSVTEEVGHTMAIKIGDSTSNNQKSLSTIMKSVLETILIRKEPPGIPSGIISLDKVIGYWQLGSFNLIAGRPSMGKTSLAITFMINAVKDFGCRALYISLENKSTDLFKQILSNISSIELSRIRSGNLTDEELKKLKDLSNELFIDRIVIDDSPGLNIIDLKTRIKRSVLSDNQQLVIIDSYQFINYHIPDATIKLDIGRELKTLAKELNIVIFLLCRLDKGLELRGGDKRPVLSDIAGENLIEAYSDLIIFVYRMEYYGIIQDEDGNSTLGLAELIIPKNRFGPLGYVRVEYLDETSLFQDVEPSNLKNDNDARF
jgi:replicative DNA helicase